MSLYDDASLALLTGAGAGKDGKLYVTKPAAEFGGELITNGGFDTDTDWTLTGSASISGGVANFGASGDYLITNDTPIPLSVKQYRIEYEVVSGNAGALRFAGGSSAFPTTTIPSTVGTHVVYATSNGTQSRLQFNSVGFIGSIDNVSVKEVLVNADFEFTRGSNLAATRVNSDGLIEKGRENILTYSNDLSQSVWTMSGANAIGGQSGYDGSNDAWTATGDVTDNWIFRRNDTIIQKSGVQTFSVYVKKNNDYGIRIYLFGSQNPNTYFNLSNGTVVQSSNDIDSKIEPVGNDWFRCSVTFNQLTNSLYIYTTNNSTLMLTNITQVFQDLQLEQGLVATEYIESGASTGLAGVLENEPRFDYSGSATCPSLLLEWSRTNLIPYSEALLSYNQFKVIGSETTIGYTSDTTPEGITSPITTISETATTGNHRAFFEDIDPCTIGSTYSFSVFAKSIGGRNIRIGDGGKGFEADTIVDLSDGTVLTDVDNNVTVNAYGNGWYRISVSGTNNSIYATQRFFINSVDGTTLSFAGDVSKGVLLWGAQFEEGGYPTSYIPNHSGGSVTRSSEASAFELSVLDFFGLSNTESGTFFIETKFIKPSANSLVDTFSQGGSGVNIWNGANFQIRDTAGSTDFTVQNITSVVDDYIKIIIRKDLTTYNVFINGVKSSTTAIITNPLKWFDHIALYRNSQMVKQMIEFPEALTDVECIKLTEL